ncbi:MAG TPA: arylsulfatase [Pirellulaceae bacterium]|nr:arylsulfatase [Pirellulaceae bacterium]
MRNLLLTVCFSFFSLASSFADDRPNIVLIMVDDMGFSDIGCYGGEIKTPNLDQLATGGLRFTQFYNCAKCETTRATLLSGQYHPSVGIGKLSNCITIAEGMKLGGYTTLMTGKWHMSSTPIDRGFDRFFGHLSGACNFFKGDNTFRLDNEPFQVPDEGFYTTDADTDYAIEFLKGADKEKPFFLYVAYNAPHYPLQAPREEVEKYRGKYTMGWDELRRTRHARTIELGIVDPSWPLSPRPDDVPPWDGMTDEQKDEQDLLMATYAGMIDRVDQNIGRLITHLKETDRYENTLFIFLSDNGACPFQRTTEKTLTNKLMPWDPESYWTYDKRWAHACNTPFREYKQNQHEGGISTAFIAHWAKGIKAPGTITDQPAHLVDLMATGLDLAGVEYPDSYGGQSIGRARGLSLAPIFAGQQRQPHDALLFTFYGKNNALRSGDWKLVNKDHGSWELYNVAEDRTELNDLSKSQSERSRELQSRWQELSEEVGGEQQQIDNGKKKKKARNKNNKN